MLSLEDTLDHAIKIPHEDFMRNLGQIGFMHRSKRVLSWHHWSIRVLARSLYFLITPSYKSDDVDYGKYEWILMNDHRGHAELFMHGIIDRFSDLSSVSLITLNRGLTLPRSDINLQLNTFRSISLNSLFYAVKYSMIRRERFIGLGVWKIPAFLTHVFDSSLIIEAHRFYAGVKFSANAKLICLCDSHWHQSVVTSTFKNRGLVSFTCIHGVPSKWKMWSPFMSDYVLSWGDSMSDAILRNCDDMSSDRLIKIGNTKYREPVQTSAVELPKPDEITEIVFISPCYNCSDTYGLKGLEREIKKFIQLSIPGVSFTIRPYPYREEIECVENLLRQMGLSGQVKILTESAFADLVVPGRLFVGSISSAIADVVILGGIFVGLCEEISRKLAATHVCYSSDIYFNMDDLEIFIRNLRDDSHFQRHLKRMSVLRDGLRSPVVESLDLYLIDKIVTHQQ
jgi:hypothetical protein